MDGKISEVQEGQGAGIFAAIRIEIEKRRQKPALLVFDAVMLVLGFLFSRLHIILGAYPVASAFIAASPVGVWQAVLGAVIGAVLDKEIIRAAVVLLVVALRRLASGTSRSEVGDGLFCEPVLFRIAAAAVANFLGAVYLIISEGLTVNALASGFSSVILSAGFAFLFSFLYDADIRFADLLFGKGQILGKNRTGREKYAFFAFEAALAVTLLLTSLSLRPYTLLGIDSAFVFSGFVALFFAKRFGAIRAMAMGFASSVAISWEYSVAFAFFGLTSGLALPFGLPFASMAAAAAAAAWGAYSGGAVGVFSVLPELSVAMTVFFPFSRFISKDDGSRSSEELCRVNFEMVSCAALSHRQDSGGEVERLGSAIFEISSHLFDFGKHESRYSLEELKERLIFTLRDNCALCPHFEICRAINPAPCVEILDALSAEVYSFEHLTEHSRELLPSYCQSRDALFLRLSEDVGAYFRERAGGGIGSLSAEYELVSRLISEARCAEERESEYNEEISARLLPVLAECGIEGGAVKVVGDRRMRVIAAGRDKTGEIISSAKFKSGLEEALGASLSSPSLYRKEENALFDALVTERYTVRYAKRSIAADDTEGSGDTLSSFKSPDGYFYSIVADGMGTGRRAGELSRLSSEILSLMLRASVSDNTALHILNHIVRRAKEERSVAIDIFRYDLQRGEGVFIKSGAAVSYVKRGASLFRVRSETAPLGLMKRIDSERIRVEVKAGDTVIMMSDGVADLNEGRLYNAISEGAASPEELAERLIEEARLSVGRDDMSVAVIELNSVGEASKSA